MSKRVMMAEDNSSTRQALAELVERADLTNKGIRLKKAAEPIEVGITYWKKLLKEFQDGQ